MIWTFFFIGLDAVEITVCGEDRTFKAYKNTDMDSVSLGRAMTLNPDQPTMTCKEVDAAGLDQESQVIMECKNMMFTISPQMAPGLVNLN